MGGATARSLLSQGADVRVLTRNPASPAATALAELGAEPLEADADSVESLHDAFRGVDGVFNVQPAFDSRGRHQADEEIQQGENVAEAVRRTGITHVVFGSAGTGEPSGIAHFDTKLEIEASLRSACPLVTVLRPAPFMELMTDPSFAPALSTWGAEPRVVGWDTPIPWVATDDVGVVAAKALLHPDQLGGRTWHLASDVASLREASALFKAVTGHPPRRIPIPVWLFSLMVGKELPRMWAYFRDHGESLRLDPATLRSVHPAALSLEQWLRRSHAPDRDESPAPA